MRVTSSTISRIFFVTFTLFCCTCASGIRAFGSSSHSASASGAQNVPAGGRAPIADASSPDFTIQIAPSPLTIVYQFDGFDEEGGEANGNATVTGTNGFAGQVNLTCSVAPPSFDEPVCFLVQNPVSVDASGPPSVVPLLITSSTPNCVTSLVGPRVMKFPGDSGWRGRMEMGIAVLALVICIGVIFPAGRRAKTLRAGFICCAALMMAGCGTSTLPTDPCGDGNFDTGTPPGTYMVTIVATSGNITHTATVPLIVPPAD
jgi:hypothetical protein